MIPISSIPENDRLSLNIGNLLFSRIGLDLNEFQFLLSIDDGKTYCDIDRHKKEIVSEME